MTNDEIITPGQFTKDEIFSQPEIWEKEIIAVERHNGKISTVQLDKYDQVVFIGCGSTFNLSLSAANLFQQLTSMSSKAVPASELLLNSKSVLTKGKTLLIAISRSGSTTETVRAVEYFKKQKQGTVISLSCYQNQPLNDISDLPIVLDQAHEKSVAQTRSFSSMLIASTYITLMLAQQQQWAGLMCGLPAACNNLLRNYDQYAKTIGEDLNIDRFYYLGSGPRYGLSCEANLKMKEMSLTHSEAFHFMEFRHGPMAMVTPTTRIVGLLSTSHRQYESQVLEDMNKLGANITRIAEEDADIGFSSGLPEPIRDVLYLPVLQLIAFYRAVRKGLDPDNPTNLTAVVNLNI